MACIDPPVPPESANIVVQYESGTVIDFGDKVSYVCKSGYFFGEDYHMTHYNLTCLPDGNFSSPLPWKQCYDPRSRP